MAKNSVRDYSATNADNTDIQSIDISEGCSPAGINNALREVMVDLKNVSTGAVALETPSADQLNVDNLRLDGNTISSTDTNGDITIDPDGTGNTVISSGNLGIGTASPSGKLNLATGASTACELRLTSNNTGSGAGDRGRIVVYSSRNDGTAYEAGKIEIDRSSGTADEAHMLFATNGGSGNTERLRIDDAGNLLVGYGGQTTTAFGQPQGMTIGSLDNVALQYYLRKGNQVEARIGFKASTDTNFYVGSGGGTGPGGIGVYGVYLTNTGNSWNSISDETQKTIVENIENASEKVSTLRTVMGYYNHDDNETRRPFLIAQDVQAVLPEAVSVQDAETGVLGMSYTDVIPLLTAAIKEQRETINILEARITALEAE